MSEGNNREYSNGEITVIWKPEICIHSAICVKNSPEVFRPQERPWVKVDAARTQEILQTVEKCPSGALTYRLEKERITVPDTTRTATETKIQAIPNGPFIVSGEIELTNSDGSTQTVSNPALCRCGASKNKPFCDGSHSEINFEG